MTYIYQNDVSALLVIAPYHVVGKEAFSRTRIIPGHSLKNGPAQRRPQHEFISVGTDALCHWFIAYIHMNRFARKPIPHSDPNRA